MSKMDFDRDVREFRHQIGVRWFDAKSAVDHLKLLTSSWGEFITESLNDKISIKHEEESNKIHGDVFGRKFLIHYGPIGMVSDGAVEAALSISDLVTGTPIELARFLITPKGVVLSPDGEKLTDLSYQGNDLKLLAAVVSHVMNSTSKA